MAKQTEQQPNIIHGRIINNISRPLANLIVQAFDRDMRSEEFLGECITDPEGKYEIAWSPGKLSGRERKTADIAMKVLTPVKKAELFSSDIDSVRFNASSREEINITIRQPIKREEVEYDYILKQVAYLAGEVAITDLQENKEHRDVTFLSKEAEIPAEKIEHLIVAHRLQKISKADAAFFYALLRKNTLLHNDFSVNLSARLSIDINTDDQTLLYDAALAERKKIVADVKAAVDDMIVASAVDKQTEKNIKILSRYQKEAESYYQNEHPKKTIELLTSFFKKDKLEEVQRLFQENKNDLNTFFEKVTDASFFKSKGKEKEAKTSIAMGQLIGFGNEVIPQIVKSKKIRKLEDVRKLARLNKSEWVEEISKANPNLKDEQLISSYASAIVRKFEREFPTAAFTAQLEREKNPVLINQDKIIAFLNKHEEFDLMKNNIDAYLKEKEISEKNRIAIGEELKSVQRIFKLIPHYQKTLALRKEKIHSAYSIVAIGETRFVKDVAPRAGLSEREATDIYRKAETKHIAALLTLGDLQDSISVMDIASFETKSLASKLEAVSKDFPNLKSLFKLTDTCECEHCRSVYSPAAYLVEILQFLDKRSVKSGNAKSVLFKRRPDLGEVDLSCVNANTPVKYIDLVCEILEDTIAPNPGIDFSGTLFTQTTTNERIVTNKLRNTLIRLPVTDKAKIFGTETATGISGPYYLRDTKVVCKINNTGGNNYKVFQLRQTLSSQEELAAAPEYVNSNAYETLKIAKYAFKLPFDLDLTEGKAYFTRFDISRAKLMEDFQLAGTPADEAIAAEKVGLTDAERNLIVIPDAANQQKYWNTTSAAATNEMKVVDTFLTKTGLSYKELDLLLALKFIDPADNLFIKHLDLTCDTEQKEIANFNDAALDRIHRFLRLQKKTGWKFEVINEIISQPKLGNKQLNDACLIKAAGLMKISEETGIKIDELIGFYGEIPHQILKDDASKPLYHRVFLNKAKNGFVDEGLLPEKVDGSQLLSNFKTSISVCLQIKEQDFDKITHTEDITTFGLPPFSVDNTKKFSNLSYLYAASRLMKKLKLKADDFVILTELTGLNISDSPEKTLEFVEVVTNFKKSSLNAANVKFMLRHEATNLGDREIKNDKIKQVLEKLQKDYQNNFSTNKSLFNTDMSAEDQKETLQNALSKLSGIGEEDVKTFIRFIDRDWTLAVDAKNIVSNIPNTILTPAQVILLNSKIDVLEAAPGPDFSVEKNDLVETFIQALDSTVVLAGLTLNEKMSILQKLLSSLSEITSDGIVILLKFIDFNRISASFAKDDMVRDKLEFIDKANTIVRTGFDGTLIKTCIDALWTAPVSTVNNKRKDLVKAFLDAIAVYQLQVGKLSILEQTLATTFKADLELVKIVLKYAALKQHAPGIRLLSDILFSDMLIDTNVAHTTPVLPAITDVTFPEQYSAIRLLHKLFPFISSFKLGNQEVDWFFRNNKSLDWFEWDSIPYERGQTAIDYAKYAAFVGIIDLSKQLTPVPNPADVEHPITFFTIAEMLLPGSSATRTPFIEAVSLLTGFNKEDVDAIDAHLLPVIPPSSWDSSHYKDVNMWKSIRDCAEHLRKLGSTVTQVKEYIKPILTSAETSRLRSTLKARYDEDTWLSTLKEIMDAIRPQKRDALVAYLLAVNPEMKNENDLYDYFLIDVKMEACMPSSRIVQAHGTIQLFVQRCLMGLEPEAIADIEKDPNWNQWKWMKNYRVWEANRKVFLYPENWYDVTLTDDKSFLLTEFINELQQNELTNDTAEEALRRYLEKLDNIAFLEILATWYDVPTKTMHVFARTKGGDPAIYYYRRFEKEYYWTPWEKVELDITGDHLLAFMRNNRLHLAWPVFSEEPDPNLELTIPDSTPGTEVDGKPKRKLKIQLALSEFANKKWQPKKVSKDAIKTPPGDNNYSATPISKEHFKFFYNQLADQIVVLNPYEKLSSAFDIVGCKGYPEVTQVKSFNLNFIPQFHDTDLIFQRYKELDQFTGDDLSVLNVHAFLSPKEPVDVILYLTPGSFRITYPHQLTMLDLLILVYEYLTMGSNHSIAYGRSFVIPKGTLLPYFMEDSSHAYVIIPGFYKLANTQFDDSEKRTVSDVFLLIEEIKNWFKKMIYEFQINPSADRQAIINTIIRDPGFQEILEKIAKYEALDFILNFIIGKTGNNEFDAVLKELKDSKGLEYGEQFKNMYHPLVCALRTVLYKEGITGLMKRETQIQTNENFNFETHYQPNKKIVPQILIKNDDGILTPSFPIEDIDFTSDGSYSLYNWDLFFRIPFHIACSLTKNQRFEEAMSWFHYMFNPTGALPGNGVQKYWVTKPFYLNQEENYTSQRIDSLLEAVSKPESLNIRELELAISEWRSKPFKPDAIARFRPVAYQKALLMKYIDNLTEWGDYLFRQDTMESIVQATQMYILADKLLGPKPRIIPPAVKAPYETYNQMEAKLDAFGNALIDIENILPNLSALPEGGAELPPSPVTLSMLYFCIPQNDKMLEYWDRVADRLFKIRHCQNIDGVERSLALFAPPIDPGMLVRAAAAGLDISSILAGINAPTPYYRFNVLSQKATELAQEVRGLGSSLLQALEKKDAEAMSLLRSELEIKVLNAVKDIKALQIKETKEQIEVLKRTKKVTEERHK
ncbi:MAG: hypothetical protein EPO24_03185, partial [Bacteroidetes bacterium]